MNSWYEYKPCTDGHVWLYTSSSTDVEPCSESYCECGLVQWQQVANKEDNLPKIVDVNREVDYSDCYGEIII